MLKHKKDLAHTQVILEWQQKHNDSEENRPWRYLAKTQIMEYFGGWSQRQTYANLLRLRFLTTDPLVKEAVQSLICDFEDIDRMIHKCLAANCGKALSV